MCYPPNQDHTSVSMFPILKVMHVTSPYNVTSIRRYTLTLASCIYSIPIESMDWGTKPVELLLALAISVLLNSLEL